MSGGISESPATGIGKLLNESRFIVPSHQRDYSWGEDEVAQLFDDLDLAMSQGQTEYFLGLVVFQKGEDDNLIVLDGQQRLATAVIIMAAVRSWLQQYSDHRDDAASIQHEHIGRRELGEKHIQPRLTLNDANNGIFSQYVVESVALEDMIQKRGQLKRQDRSRQLLISSIYAHERVRQIAQASGSDAGRRLTSLVKYIRDSAKVIRLTVTNASIAYTVFETLNDRGIDLSPLDLVKNHIFSKAISQSPSTLRDMEARWTQMMSTLANVKSVGAFLKAFWTSRHGRVRTRNLFDELKETYSDAAGAIELSEDMLAAAEFYAALEVADDPVWASHLAETREHVRNLKTLGWQLFYPVALAALGKFDSREMARLLRLFEVIVVRYQIALSGNTGKLETTTAILARKIHKGEITTATQAFQELKDYYPPDAEFQKAFGSKQERNNQKAQYLLRAIERQARVNASGQQASEVDLGTLTIEHILPRNPGSAWAEDIASDPSLPDDCTYRLGNLCLLTKVNKEAGRKAFADKVGHFKDSQILTTKEVAEHPKWGRMEIKHRQASLAKLAAQAWRF